ncbi:hypothetical protein C4F50_17845 [Flavobacterium sp. KB82]|uniref:Uncharacterized protein n=2 Tax=Flavobacterium hungaricum TaxID=2082725 RepID=A0ABR9TN53_9FLAO|nr:hypothetical protein [Flavobacterium hungaricum]
MVIQARNQTYTKIMAILKQAKNIVINVHSDSTAIVNNNMTKTAKKITMRSIQGNLEIHSINKINKKSNGN